MRRNKARNALKKWTVFELTTYRSVTNHASKQLTAACHLIVLKYNLKGCASRNTDNTKVIFCKTYLNIPSLTVTKYQEILYHANKIIIMVSEYYQYVYLVSDFGFQVQRICLLFVAQSRNPDITPHSNRPENNLCTGCNSVSASLISNWLVDYMSYPGLLVNSVSATLISIDVK